MNHFLWTDYGLISISVASQAAIGRRLGVNGFISQSLAGLCLSGLGIACLANISAGLIRPSILIVISFSILLSIVDAFRSFHYRRSIQSKNLLSYAILGASGLVFFLFNNPRNVFLKFIGSQSLLRHNELYPYYASVPTEMLNADYGSRLKVISAFPHEWSRFHFFHGSIEAVAQGLILHPGLFTYFMVQVILVIVILLSFGERLFLDFGLSLRTVILGGGWILTGFTVFSNQLNWNLSTTGLFSVFAIVHLVFALLKNTPGQALMFAFILGASAFRLMPASLIAIAGILGLYFWDASYTGFWKLCKRLTTAHYMGIALFCIYNILTILAEPSIVNPADPFDLCWIHPLVSYQLLGYIFGPFMAMHPFMGLHNLEQTFRIPFKSPAAYAFIVLFLGLIALACYHIFRVLYRSRPPVFSRNFLKTWNRMDVVLLFFLLILLAQVFKVPGKSAALFMVAFPYFVFIVFLLIQLDGKIAASGCRIEVKKPFYIFSLMMVFSLILQYWLDKRIAVPILYTVLELLLWSVLGVFLMSIEKLRGLLIAVLLMLIAGLYMRTKIKNTLEIYGNRKVDVTRLMDPSAKRAEWVDQNGFLRNREGEYLEIESFSSILGARIPYMSEWPARESPRSGAPMNYQFMLKK